MSALDWANWLRSGQVVGISYRHPATKQVGATKRRMDQEQLANSVKLNRLIAVHVAATTKSVADW